MYKNNIKGKVLNKLASYKRAINFVLRNRQLIKTADEAKIHSSFQDFLNNKQPLNSGEGIRLPQEKILKNEYVQNSVSQDALNAFNTAQNLIYQFAPHYPQTNISFRKIDGEGSLGQYNHTDKGENDSIWYDINHLYFNPKVFFHEPGHGPVNETPLVNLLDKAEADNKINKKQYNKIYQYGVEQPATANEYGYTFIDRNSLGMPPLDNIDTVGNVYDRNNKFVAESYTPLYRDNPYMHLMPQTFRGPFGSVAMEQEQIDPFKWIQYTLPTGDNLSGNNLQFNVEQPYLNKLNDLGLSTEDPIQRALFIGTVGIPNWELLDNYYSNSDDYRNSVNLLKEKILMEQSFSDPAGQLTSEDKDKAFKRRFENERKQLALQWACNHPESWKYIMARADLSNPGIQNILAVMDLPSSRLDELPPEILVARVIGKSNLAKQLEQAEEYPRFIGRRALWNHIRRGINPEEAGGGTPVAVLQALSQQRDLKTSRQYFNLYEKIKTKLQQYKTNPYYLNVMQSWELSPWGDSLIGANDPTLTIEQMQQILKDFEQADTYQEIESSPQFQGYGYDTMA